MDAELEPERTPEAPGAMLRTASITALVIFLAALGFVLLLVVPRFEQMFREMDLGKLSLATRLVLLFSKVAVNFWYLGLVAAAGLVWFHQKWIAKKRERIIVFLCVLIVAAAAFAVLIAIGLVEPLITPLPERVDK